MKSRKIARWPRRSKPFSHWSTHMLCPPRLLSGDQTISCTTMKVAMRPVVAVEARPIVRNYNAAPAVGRRPCSPRRTRMNDIVRVDPIGGKLSDAVEYNGLVYLAGQVSEKLDGDMKAQTEDVL